MAKELLREIPSVDECLTSPELAYEVEELGQEFISDIIREVQDHFRQSVLAGEHPQVEKDEVTDYLLTMIKHHIKEYTRPNLTSVVNSTGTILHTNLGRAPLAESVLQGVSQVGSRYSNLEMDLSDGSRGSRYSHVTDLITKLTGAEDCMVVNNNAAAVLLVLKHLAAEKEVIISRGELVEVGGSFRIPEVMKQSGAKLVEVGATNKTNHQDFESAISDETGCLLKVHTSNYRIVGFTESVTTKKLVDLAHSYNLPFVEDLGSGLLLNLKPYGITEEPTVKEVLDKGVDLVTFSGDKLLGASQAGIIAGKKDLLSKLKKDQLVRALRVDKLTLKALEGTLRLYLNPEEAKREIPILRAITCSEADLKKTADDLYRQIVTPLENQNFQVTVERDISKVGGGAMPTVELPTWVVSVSGDGRDLTDLSESLRHSEPPVLVRVKKEKLIFDVRTLLREDVELIAEVIDRL